MASYIEWNQALIYYFTEGEAQGARVYLSVDDDVLDRIGRHFRSSPNGYSWRDDFCQAVRKEIGINSSSGGNKVNLDRFQSSFSTPPTCIAFLGLMVLAAYEMNKDNKDENANVNASNYYRRFRGILKLTTSEVSAPKGMSSHHELWGKWNKWLKYNGFLSTACQGNTQPIKYINYPISQSILRKADKQSIYKFVEEQGLRNNRNIDVLMQYLRLNTGSLTRHLKKLLDDNLRLEVIKRSIQDALDDENEKNDQARSDKKPLANSRSTQSVFGERRSSSDNGDSIQGGNLTAQIYREENYLVSEYPSFYLYPKEKKGIDLIAANVVIDGVSTTLQKGDSEGWYLPIYDYPISSEILNQGARYQIVRSPSNDISICLVLDKQNFWILTLDPDCPESGIYASFGKVSLGKTFILLCRKELVGLVERLQSELLLRFNLCTKAFENNLDWVEFQQCVILSKDWEGVDIGIEGKQLKDALQPAANVEICLTGGLRVPHLNAWLIEDLPVLTIFSSLVVDQAEVLIFTDLSTDGVPISRKIVKTNVPNPDIFIIDGTVITGKYEIRVNCGRLFSQKIVNFVNWDDLEIREPSRKEKLKIGNWEVNGSQICSLGNKEEIHE
jgi:hypothetical protein